MGLIWMLGDNVNTDVIIPGRYNVTTDRTQLARYCLCEVLPEFAQQVKAGDVVMAGHNFGCGSSREHAPAALQHVAFMLSLHVVLRVSSIAMPSTLVCLYLSAKRPC